MGGRWEGEGEGRDREEGEKREREKMEGERRGRGGERARGGRMGNKETTDGRSKVRQVFTHTSRYPPYVC